MFMLFFCNITDVVGSLCGVGDIEIVGAGWKRKRYKSSNRLVS